MEGPFKTNFFCLNEVHRVLYKLVLVTYPLNHFWMLYSPLNFRFIKKTKEIKCVPITTIISPKINLEHLELLRPWGPQSQLPGLHDSNLNTLSTQIPRGQKLLGYIKEEWQIKMMAVFFFIAHEKGFEFHVQPQTGAYSCLAKSPNGRGQKKAPPHPMDLF